MRAARDFSRLDRHRNRRQRNRETAGGAGERRLWLAVRRARSAAGAAGGSLMLAAALAASIRNDRQRRRAVGLSAGLRHHWSAAPVLRLRRPPVRRLVLSSLRRLDRFSTTLRGGRNRRDISRCTNIWIGEFCRPHFRPCNDHPRTEPGRTTAASQNRGQTHATVRSGFYPDCRFVERHPPGDALHSGHGAPP